MGTYNPQEGTRNPRDDGKYRGGFMLKVIFEPATELGRHGTLCEIVKLPTMSDESFHVEIDGPVLGNSNFLLLVQRYSLTFEPEQRPCHDVDEKFPEETSARMSAMSIMAEGPEPAPTREDAGRHG